MGRGPTSPSGRHEHVSWLFTEQLEFGGVRGASEVRRGGKGRLAHTIFDDLLVLLLRQFSRFPPKYRAVNASGQTKRPPYVENTARKQ